MDCPIPGVLIRKLMRHEDARGWLMELFRQDELPPDLHPVMGYVSTIRPNATRGPHEHRQQSDHFALLGPSSMRLYLWDNRPDSKTFGTAWELTCDGKEALAIIVPPGVVHAYRNLGSLESFVYNAPNHLYAGHGRCHPVDETRHEEDPNSPFRIKP